jgi:DNA-binding NarL/FixJ family response regulator
MSGGAGREDQQVEQSGASSLLVHPLELAGRAIARIRNRGAPDLRETLVRYLGAQPGLRCTHAYPNAETALAELPMARPDVVLMDINLPGMNDIECVGKLRLAMPGVKIIMLTVFQESDQVFNALSAGAFGYLVKSSRPAKIVEAIREVY